MIKLEPFEKTPVFLICSERSGSNLISTIMGTHSSVFSLPPFHLGRDFLLNLPLVMTNGISSEAWDILCAHIISSVENLGGEKMAARLRVWLSKLDEVNPEHIARFLYLGLAEKPGATHVFVKENNIHHLIFFLIESFPNARFVFQVRDPRDFLASAKARKKRLMGNKFGSLRRSMEVWREDQLGGLRALSLLGPQRVLLVRYENLVAHAKDTVTAICDHINVPFEPKMLDFHKTEGAEKLAKSAGARTNLTHPLMTQNFNKYRKSLSRRDIKFVESAVGDLMEVFGYERDFTAHSGRLSNIRPILMEPFERMANGETDAFYKSGSKKLARQLKVAAKPIIKQRDQT